MRFHLLLRPSVSAPLPHRLHAVFQVCHAVLDKDRQTLRSIVSPFPFVSTPSSVPCTFEAVREPRDCLVLIEPLAKNRHGLARDGSLCRFARTLHLAYITPWHYLYQASTPCQSVHLL